MFRREAKARTACRWLIGATCASTVVAMIVLVALRVSDRPGAGRRLKMTDTWAVRGLRHTQVNGDLETVRITADEARLARVPFGVFRVGFAWRLYARNARIEMRGGVRPPVRADWRAAGRVAGRRRRASKYAVTTVESDGFALRLEMSSGVWAELAADKCHARLRDAGHVVFKGNVRVSTPGAVRDFRRLDYDIASRQFVDTKEVQRWSPVGREPSSVPSTAARADIDFANAAFWRVGGLDPAVLGNSLTAILPN